VLGRDFPDQDNAQNHKLNDLQILETLSILLYSREQ
jgi:hypothetical protein